jgi:beta-ribofuranosylaminobenzene 5'-phosphate synthase
MSVSDLFSMLKELEQSSPVSPLQKILLLTDGSVTNLLEVVAGERIEVHTLAQQVVRADPAEAADLGIEAGDLINFRVVDLVGAESKRTYVHAVSHTPLDHLEPEFRDDLMAADIPIGRILQRYHMETRREIRDIRPIRADRDLSRTFRVPAESVLFSRRYAIIHDQKPLIFIEEIFSPALWEGVSISGQAGAPLPVPAEDLSIRVEAPSRLHLGLIDMHGGLGRVDGGIGITLMNPCTGIEVKRGEDLTVTGGTPEVHRRVLDAARKVLDAAGIRGGAAITVKRSMPQHTGLGSGTQIALATGAAISKLYSLDLSVRRIAAIVGRGGTSGIGTAAFEHGGFILDGGHSFGPHGEKHGFAPSAASSTVTPATVCARLPFPEAWKIVLAIPNRGTNVGGAEEVNIFRDYCPVPIEDVSQICHEIMTRMLPGIAEEDLDLFAHAVNAIQTLGFKKVETSLQDPVVPALIRELRQAGAACAGLSSFGPTVFAITDGDLAGITRAAAETFGEQGGEVIVTRGRNYGAVY